MQQRSAKKMEAHAHLNFYSVVPAVELQIKDQHRIHFNFNDKILLTNLKATFNIDACETVCL
jgi:hypothetical protein